MAGIDIQHFDVNSKMALSAKTTTSERLHGILLMTESTSREKASPERTDGDGRQCRRSASGGFPLGDGSEK
ncbi:hypothetical protein E4Q95_20185 [Salmonella enterica]|nr:hypothetical protein [Salmonella enterica]